MIALGFRPHTAWTVAVALRGPVDAPEVIDRWRFGFVPDDMPAQVFHAASALALDEAEALVRRWAELATHTAELAVRDLAAELGEVGAAGVVLGTGRASISTKRAIASHAAKHAGEGELARRVLIDAGTSAGLEVLGVRESELDERGSSLLALGPDELRGRIVELGRAVGAPWAKDHKQAALVAWLALASRS